MSQPETELQASITRVRLCRWRGEPKLVADMSDPELLEILEIEESGELRQVFCRSEHE